MSCAVLRCIEPGSTAFDFGTAESGVLEALVCARHGFETEEGARWLWQEDVDGRAGIRVGADLPPHITDVSLARCHFGPGPADTYLATIDVLLGDGATDVWEIELPAPLGDALLAAWRELPDNGA